MPAHRYARTLPLPEVAIALACSAGAPALRGDVEVRACVFMALRAMRLLRVVPDTVAAHDVLVLRNRLEMARVHASLVSTEMVENEPLRDRSDEEHVRHPVSEPLSRLVYAESSGWEEEDSVTVTLESAAPDPATIIGVTGNLLPEPLL